VVSLLFGCGRRPPWAERKVILETQVDSFLKAGLADFSLTELRWENRGQDLILGLVSPSDVSVFLRFLWVSNLTLDMTFRDYGGPPFLFESLFKRNDNDTWEVVLDFGGRPKGAIHFDCNQVELLGQPPGGTRTLIGE
jgi:hypothetical protein